jgi:fucose 4-O-acetylase-like acetyltransferase
MRNESIFDKSEDEVAGSSGKKKSAGMSPRLHARGFGAERLIWLDSAKGAAISLVVFGHVLGGAMDRNWLNRDGAARQLYDFIYLFHMPFFFMASGLVLVRQAKVAPVRAFVARVGSIAWPYFVWDVVLRWALLPFVNRFMGSPPAIASPQELLVQALTGELSWFLWTLFLTQVLFIFLLKLSVPLSLFVSVVLAVLLSDIEMGAVKNVFEYMPYLLVGAFLGIHIERLRLRGNTLQLSTALSVFIIMAIGLEFKLTHLVIVRILFGIAGSFAMAILIQCFTILTKSNSLAKIGNASLAIYVMHPYF